MTRAYTTTSNGAWFSFWRGLDLSMNDPRSMLIDKELLLQNRWARLTHDQCIFGVLVSRLVFVTPMFSYEMAGANP